jgi:two-component system CheB/CheR fusion protein
LIRGIPVPVLMLDREQCVRHFSPAAAELFALDETSLGVPLGVAHTFAPATLQDALNEALQELRPVEREVRDINERWYMLWARAYQTSENRIEGAVLAFQDIHHLKLALENANAARAEAERANAAKNDFLALVSHELRAPLNVISNWVQLLRLLHVDPAADARVATGLSTIERSCRDQARLIDDLLDVSRITSGNLVLDLRPVDFAGIVRAAIESLAPQAGSKGIVIGNSGLDEALVIAGDTRRLQQIVVNVLGNAIKFTPADGHIDVALARVDTFAELVISDSGIGISAEELARVFERFTQSDISKTRKYGGMGLGLSIVRNLTEAHGGSVSAHSDGLGRGARFVVRLPLAAMALPAGAEEIERAVPALSLHGVEILLVDDEAAGRDALAHMLGALGANVHESGDALQALQELEQRTFDVLVADIAMPGLDGYELMRRIRKLPHEAQYTIYAIALTGFASLGERDEAIAAGFDAHFGKPPNLNAIAARIISGLRARDAGRTKA